MKQIKRKSVKTCEMCRGTGSFQEGGTFSPYVSCDVCGGSGLIKEKTVSKKHKKKHRKLTFHRLHDANVKRCLESFGHLLSDWSLAEWSNAMCGEAGETANITKKIRRGDKPYSH
jgi:hypothetical protein